MKEIILTKGYVALVDDEDYERVNQHKWCASERPSGKVYAMSWMGGALVLMHRFLLGLTSDDPRLDHRNGNGLDNRRNNLRSCTNSENGMNTTKKPGNTSQYKGVCWDKVRGKWSAEIMLNYKKKYLGRFVAELEAAKAYDAAAMEYFGEFARLNLSMGNAG